MESKENLQAWNNFVYAVRKHGLEMWLRQPLTTMLIKPDRVIFQCLPQIETMLNIHKNFTRDSVILKKAHPTAYASWRENVSTFALQVCLGYKDEKYYVEIDCDYGRPFYDVVGWLVHATEVVYNKVTGRVTNPFKVRAAWNKRGYGIPLISEALNA